MSFSFSWVDLIYGFLSCIRGRKRPPGVLENMRHMWALCCLKRHEMDCQEKKPKISSPQTLAERERRAPIDPIPVSPKAGRPKRGDHHVMSRLHPLHAVQNPLYSGSKKGTSYHQPHITTPFWSVSELGMSLRELAKRLEIG